MAAITSAQSGLWSAGATWVGGVVPANGDSVVIAASHVVEFNVDQSGFASGIAGVTLNGTLRASTTPGAYVLKLAGHMTPGAAGRLEAGTAETPYPTACSFEVRVNGNYYAINGGTNAAALYCAQPTHQIIKLVAAASAGQTVLTVDTDVSGDLWRPGDMVVIANINRAQEYEIYTLASVGAGTITLSSGLTRAKLAGAVVTLSTRNVRLIGPGTSSGNGAYNTQAAKLRCEIRNFQTGVFSGVSHVISGPISGCYTGVYYGSSHVISGPISGCSNGVSSGVSHVISGPISGCYAGVSSGVSHVISGPISGCYTGVYYGSSHVVSGSISGCYTGVFPGSVKLYHATLSSNTRDLTECSGVAYASALNSAVQIQAYASFLNTPFVAWDIGGVPGAVKAWMAGGRITPDNTLAPEGYTTSHRMIHERASVTGIATPVYLDTPVLLSDKATRLTAWLRRDTAVMDELPRAQIVAPDADPLVDPEAAPLFEQIMSAGVDQWERIDIEYSAARLIPGAVLRIRARNASGNVWFQTDVPALAIEWRAKELRATIQTVVVRGDVVPRA